MIIKLGSIGRIKGFDIDTGHFNGNEGPAASVYALKCTDGKEPTANSAEVNQPHPVLELRTESDWK